MNVASVKTGRRGRPRFRRYTGFIFQHGSYWAFRADSLDLFGPDSVLLNVSYGLIPERVVISVCRSLAKGDSVHVELSFSGKYSIVGQLAFFDFRFVRFVA